MRIGFRQNFRTDYTYKKLDPVFFYGTESVLILLKLVKRFDFYSREIFWENLFGEISEIG